jgi:hypothetical protein
LQEAATKRSVFLVLILTISLLGRPGLAAKDRYRQPVNVNRWKTTKLDVIVVPPSHGPLVNENGVLSGGNPDEATPFNSYVDATKKSIAEYTKVVRRYGPRWLKKRLEIRTYVVGQDNIPERVREDPEAVIVFGENQGVILGVTITVADVDPECLISNSMSFTASFTHTDMYNVNLHEFGHCLGLDHFAGPSKDQIFRHENMTPNYFHNPGTAGTHRHCVSNFNLRGVALAFSKAAGKKPAGNVVTGGRDAYRLLRCSNR